MDVYMIRKVKLTDAARERREGETLVLNQVGPNWWDVDAYLTDAPAKLAGEWVQTVLYKLELDGQAFPV